MSSDSAVFDDLPQFDPSNFKPPAWATGPAFNFAPKNGESSKSGQNGLNGHDLRDTPRHRDTHSSQTSGNAEGDKDDDDDEGEDEEIWEDAQDSLEDTIEETPDGLAFTVPELKKLVTRAQTLKGEGNTAFTSKPPNTELAIQKYESALKLLPPVPKLEAPPTPAPASTGIQEITDEEAEAIASAEKAEEKGAEVSEREAVEMEVRDCGKACHGNLAACWALLKEDKKVVEACNQALELDPVYTKALHRRATANDRIGSWSSLTSAKEDYEKLLKLIPTSSPQYPSTRIALSSLPRRIAAQQDKEKDEMLNQLKELGNGLLGKFGLSTDMFKFEQQEGGGYGVKFER